MLKYIKLCFISAFFFGGTYLMAQNSDLASPLDIPLELSASFAELRTNHFHGGLDFKTKQKEGLPIYAIEDGHIARICVSSTGYGNALYITHPNGLMSVYAHLSAFTPEVKARVRKEQYAKKSFEVNFWPDEVFTVKKGDLIGYSGNSGSSEGPHLHFEIRNRSGANAINPSLFGYRVKDNIPPALSTLAIYPYNKNSFVNGMCAPLHIPVSAVNKGYKPQTDTIDVYGDLAFGIEAIDRANGHSNKLGLHSLKLFINDSLSFYWQIDSVTFSETSYINAFMDYAHYDSTKNRIQWTIRQPNSNLGIYKEPKSDGVYSFTEEGLQKLRFECRDIENNLSVLHFTLNVKKNIGNICEESVDSTLQTQWFEFEKTNVFTNSLIKIAIPPKALYDNILFTYKTECQDSIPLYSPLHHVHASGTPLHARYYLEMKPQGLPKEFENKALVVSFDKKGKMNAEGGHYKNGFVSVNIKKFSIFAIAIDTICPEIKPLNINNNTIPVSQNHLIFEITDDLSGIETYTAEIDGEWFLMEYDSKNNKLSGEIEKVLQAGEHQFKLTVGDRKKNTTIYEAKIQR